MTKKELVDSLDSVQDTEHLSVVIHEDSEDVESLEIGSVLDIVDTGFIRNVGAVVYVRPR